MRRTVVYVTLVATLVCAGVSEAWADASFLDRREVNSFRVMSYNPYWDAIFPVGRRRYDRSGEFERVLRAVHPDIVCLQEVDPRRDVADVLTIFDRVLPLPPGERWTAVTEADNVIVSRFPFVWTRGDTVTGRGVRARGHVITLVDLPDDLSETDVLIAGTHFVSGGAPDQIQARTDHAESLVMSLRDAIAETGSAGPLDLRLPVIIAGDLNAYGTDPRRHLDVLIEMSELDPSGAPMEDLLPLHNGVGPDTWTWRDDTDRFEPYPLDRIIYTGSLLVATNSFVLNSSTMDEALLKTSGLLIADVALDLDVGHFDHLPLVVDFTARAELR